MADAREAAFTQPQTCTPEEATKSDSQDSSHFSPPDSSKSTLRTPSALCLPISNKVGQKPSRLRELNVIQSPSALCHHQVNDNAMTNIESSYRTSLKLPLSSSRRRSSRHRRRLGGGGGVGGFETRSASNAEAIQGGFLENHLKAINDLKLEATATSQRVQARLKKLCEERMEEFKRKQVHKYNIRWKLRLRQLENFHSFRQLTSSRLFPGLTRVVSRSASPPLPIQPPSPPSLPPTPPISPLLGVRQSVRSRSLSPQRFIPSRKRGLPRSFVMDIKNVHLRQRPLKRCWRVNAEELLTVIGASLQLSKRELETLVKWEKKERERFRKVMTFRLLLEEEAQNQTVKPIHELLNILTKQANDISQELQFLNNTKRNLFACGDATFKFGAGSSSIGSSLEHLELLMAASSNGRRSSSISYLPRFHTLNSSRIGLCRHHRFCEGSPQNPDPTYATPRDNRWHRDETTTPLNQRSLGSLARELKRLDSRAFERFFGCLDHHRTLLGGRNATLPKGMIRAADWRQEMLGLELWTSRLSTNSDFSYFELSPLVGRQKRWEELEDMQKGAEGKDIEEGETISESESDYCN
ncbi:hypothetical protein ECG_03398 [Echinococcus granulosus]|nr:hypothetical protein ECG_03398 [Echinococcus granulosus]